MKDLTTFLREAIEVETLQDKTSAWFLRNPEQALLWTKIVDKFTQTHQWDEYSLEKFSKQKDVKDFLKFLQDDVNADIDGIDVMNTLKQVISNLK